MISRLHDSNIRQQSNHCYDTYVRQQDVRGKASYDDDVSDDDL